jgi:DNA repair exonuclease SbcCD ATPase subunit
MLMDRQFLEFWGNYLLAAARGQKQLEDLNQWISQGFSGFEELTAMFQKFYGLKHPDRENTDSAKAWQSATSDFREAFKAYLNLMGVVSKDEYQALARKNAKLQEKVAEQADTIKRLRELLAEKGTYQGETVKVFQDLVKKQGDSFEKLMRNIAADSKDEE